MSDRIADVKDIEDIVRLVGNDVYKVIYEKIYMHEHRGFNAHQRSQAICEQVKIEVRHWLKKNYGLDQPGDSYPEDRM